MLAGGEHRVEVRRVTVSEAYAGQRLDNFLVREMKGVPRSHLYRLLRTGQVRVNGGRRRPDYRLDVGDELRLPPVNMVTRPAPVGPLKRGAAVLVEGILYEDDVLLVLNKPSGLPVHGGSGLDGGLIEALRRLRDEPELELVHRLDRDTSGCLLIARRRSALRSLHAAFREGRVHKRYLALVAGQLREPFTSKAPLERFTKRGGERYVAVKSTGRAAQTRFRPLACGEAFSLVEVLPDTGRTHQIRVHAAHARHPIAGDSRYGDKVRNRELRALGLRRLALHAAGIALAHPRTGAPLAFSAPLPADLRSVMVQLTGYSGDGESLGPQQPRGGDQR